MSRIRTIKPEFWVDERLGECSTSARLLFIATWTFADDEGNLDRSSKQLKAQAFPYDNLDPEPLVRELLEHGLLTEYGLNGTKYLHINNFSKHQRIDRKSPPRFPIYEDSMNTLRVIDEDSRLKGREGNISLSPEPSSGFELSPPKPNGKADPRFKAAVDAIKSYWDLKNPDRPFVFGPSDGKQLKEFLNDCRQLTIEQFQYCLQQRAQSQVVHSDRPRKWISDLMAYANGPLDKFKKPLETK